MNNSGCKTKVQNENYFRAERVLINKDFQRVAWYSENQTQTTPDLNGFLVSSVETNPRPFLESLISSLPSTPLSHESCLPVFHSTWLFFVRTDAMVLVFSVSAVPLALHTLQLLPVFHRQGTQSKASDHKKCTVTILRLPSLTITTFSL